MTENTTAQPVTFGDRYVRRVPELGLVIFGIVIPLAEQIASEYFGLTEFDDSAAGKNARQQVITEANDILRRIDWDRTSPLSSEQVAQLEHHMQAHTRLSADQMQQGRYIMASTREGWLDGRRFVKAYSVVEPRGEYGYELAHRCHRITDQMFAEARAAGFSDEGLLETGHAWIKVVG